MDRTRLRAIVAIGLPLIGGMTSQNLMNLIDTAMVGVLGPTALAGVGVASYVNFTCFALLMGLGVGVQAMVARRQGAGRARETAVPLNAGLIITAVFGAPLTVLLIWLAPAIVPLVNDDPAIVAVAVPYLIARLLSVVAISANFAFRGFWSATDQARLYLYVLLIMHAANVAISYVLIFGPGGLPAFGALGAGIGTTAATFLGTAIYVGLAWRRARPNGFLRGRPDRASLITVVRLAIPSSIQSFLFAAGFAVLFAIVAQLGLRAVAASHVLLNLALVMILPGMALGLAAASLAGQALGRGDPRDAERWGWDVVKVAIAMMAAIGIPMLLAPDLILALFIHEPETAAIARPALRLIGAITVVEAVAVVMQQALNGTGATRATLMVSIATQWGLFLPLAWLAGPVWGAGMLGIWLAYGAHRLVAAAILATLWRRGRWQMIRV